MLSMWIGGEIDERGIVMLEWTYASTLHMLNDGKIPTLVRKNGKSFVDLTLISGDIISKPVKWEVLEDESLSDHRYVLTYIQDKKQSVEKRFTFGKTDMEKYKIMLKDELAKSDYSRDVDKCTEAMQVVYKKCTPKINTKQGMSYWWTGDISKLLKSARHKRRLY